MRRFYVVVVVLAVGCAGSTKSKSAETVPQVKEPVAQRAPDQENPHEHMPAVEPWTLSKLSQGAKLIGNLGKVGRPITTTSAEAQKYFDQGMALMYGFNHDEAARSFARAAELDPTCAMCFWGAAYTLGPNYNIPMLPERAQAAWEGVQKAQQHAGNVSDVEKALIEALSVRYKGPEYLDPEAMKPYTVAYAQAMRKVAQKFPNDDDVQVLFAESLMDVNPWKLWSAEGEPAEGTPEIVSAIETVLSRKPDHAGANHYYIHAVEASKQPEKALPSADRLGGIAPAAGHLVHMPAHIYQRIGRYADASEANRKAIEADRKYMETMTPPGYYPFYMGHNYGFLAYSSSMEGRSAEALSAARKAAETIPKDVVCGMPGMDFFLAEPLLVEVRFGMWDEVKKEPMPDEKYQTLVALWHHAQGMALASTGKPDQAKVHLEEIRALTKSIPEKQLAGLNSGRAVLGLAAKVLEARIAEVKKDESAIELLQEAVKMEDGLSYNEPADWFYPTRHLLGAALVDAGRAKDAIEVYRADLERNPKNGWALFGLAKALEAEDKNSEARATKKAHQTAFARADITLARSAF